MTKKEILTEAEKEKEYNDLFETVIKKMPFGKFYSLMIGASKLLTKHLKKHIAIDDDGKPIIIYNSKMGKFLGVFAEPMHKRLAREFAHKAKNGKERRKKWGHILGNLLGFGELIERKKQNKKYKRVYKISPDDVTYHHTKKMIKENPHLKPKILEAVQKKVNQDKIEKFLEGNKLSDVLKSLNK